MTIANSVEARVSFLDHAFVESVIALPPGMKIRDGVGKYSLKRALDGLLPNEIISRRKQGFGVPIQEWLRGSLGDKMHAEVRRSSLASRCLQNYDVIDQLWTANRSGRADWSAQLWNVYNVSMWHDHWIAGRARGLALL